MNSPNSCAYYHAIGLPHADKTADDYAAAIEGMYETSASTTATLAHWGQSEDFTGSK
jgi:hypothetical protein